MNFNIDMNNILKYILIFVAGIVLGLFIINPSCSKQDEERKIEYVPVHDTITINKEVIREKEIIRFTKDTFIKIDTFIEKEDGTYVEMPIEYKTYKDTITSENLATKIEISHHGILSEIDNVQLFQTYNNKIETITKPAKKVTWTWCVGVGAGVGGNLNVYPNITAGVGPSVGIYAVIGIGGPVKK